MDILKYGADCEVLAPVELKERVSNEIEHGHHIFRAYWKHAFIKQYEKFATYLRDLLKQPLRLWPEEGA